MTARAMMDAGSRLFQKYNSDTVVLARNVSKKFCKNLKRSMAYGIVDLSKNLVGIKSEQTELRQDEFWALNRISFQMERGETLGIIGANGSGKTTLLRLLAGILPPDLGEIAIVGRLGALIAIGAGFHPHMTGRENIFLNGTVLGMSKKEIYEVYESIVDFADIGDFLESPVSTYSSGMRVRLGFSIAVHAKVDLLLVDEVLAVGDTAFQLKCFNKIGELRKNGLATIIVSHNMHSISTFCNRLIVLDKGKMLYSGNVEEGIQLFRSHVAESFFEKNDIEKVITGTDEFKILAVEFMPSLQNNLIEMNGVSNLEISITYETLKDFSAIEIDITLRLPIPSPNDFFQASNSAFQKRINICKGKGKIKISIMNINLNNFQSRLFIALWEKNREHLILWWRNIPVRVIGNALMSGWSRFDIAYEVVQYDKKERL